MPQENGNRVDTRWMQIENQTVALRFTADSKHFEFSARHHTDDDLFSSFHLNELVEKKREETIVNIDHGQRGVGTGSCGPLTFEWHRMDPDFYQFEYTITVYAVSNRT